MPACLNCNHVLEQVIAAPGNAGLEAPAIGDFVMCEECGHIQVIKSNTKFRKLTVLEKRYIDGMRKKHGEIAQH